MTSYIDQAFVVEQAVVAFCYAMNLALLMYEYCEEGCTTAVRKGVVYIMHRFDLIATMAMIVLYCIDPHGVLGVFSDAVINLFLDTPFVILMFAMAECNLFFTTSLRSHIESARARTLERVHHYICRGCEVVVVFAQWLQFFARLQHKNDIVMAGTAMYLAVLWVLALSYIITSQWLLRIMAFNIHQISSLTVTPTDQALLATARRVRRIQVAYAVFAPLDTLVYINTFVTGVTSSVANPTSFSGSFQLMYWPWVTFVACFLGALLAWLPRSPERKTSLLPIGTTTYDATRRASSSYNVADD